MGNMSNGSSDEAHRHSYSNIDDIPLSLIMKNT